MTEPVLVPGARDVRGTLTRPDAAACVVACPPHPRHGGTRSDPRLVAVADALSERDIACLRFDYGPWDEGRGERADAENAVEWAEGRFDRVGLFGYSFGAAVALSVAAHATDLCGVSVLAPPAEIGAIDAVADVVRDVSAPLQVLYGERDESVDWAPVVEAATDRGTDVVPLAGDHLVSTERGRVGSLVARFFAGQC